MKNIKYKSTIAVSFLLIALLIGGTLGYIQDLSTSSKTNQKDIKVENKLSNSKANSLEILEERNKQQNEYKKDEDLSKKEKRKKAEKIVENKLSVEHSEKEFRVQFDKNLSTKEIKKITEDAGIKVASEEYESPAFQEERLLNVLVKSPDDLKDAMVGLELEEDVVNVSGVYPLKKASWSTSGGDKAYPGEFDLNTADVTYGPKTGDHWYLEQSNLPQVWYDQDCHNAGEDCGGKNEVVVAVLDTGVAFEDYVHGSTQYNTAPDLTNMNIWTNPTEEYDDDVDNDNNYYCDDKHGIDVGSFLCNGTQSELCGYQTVAQDCSLTQRRKDGHPNDDDGHGTFVAGIIGATLDDATGSVGLSSNVSIMPVKISYPADSILAATSLRDGTTKTLWYGLKYAIDEGADIINISMTTTYNDPFIESKIAEAVSKGIVVIAASGNDGSATVLYPAKYDDVIAVGAAKDDGSHDPANFIETSYSNYGPEVDLIAPVGEGGTKGDAIYQQTYTCSDIIGGSGCTVGSDFTTFSTNYHTAQGTSYAAAQVSGIIAMMKSNELNSDGTYLASLLNMTRGSSKIPNLENALFSRAGLYSSIRDINGKVKTQLSFNGINWSDWNSSVLPNDVTSNVSTIIYDDELFQGVIDEEGLMYTRNTPDGFDWTDWDQSGVAQGNISFVEFNNRLYEGVVKEDGRMYTRYLEDASSGTWSNWYQSGVGQGDISFALFDVDGETRLYEGIIKEDGRCFTRYTTTGDDGDWSAWAQSGVAQGNMSLIVFNDRLYQGVIKDDGRMFTRYIDNTGSWSNWYQSGVGQGNIEFEIFNTGSEVRLYEGIIKDDGRCFSRYTTTGDDGDWSSWYESGNAKGDMTFSLYQNILYKGVVKEDGRTFVQRSVDGDTWSSWIQTSYYDKEGTLDLIDFTP